MEYYDKWQFDFDSYYLLKTNMTLPFFRVALESNCSPANA